MAKASKKRHRSAAASRSRSAVRAIDGEGTSLWWRSQWMLGLLLAGVTLALYWSALGLPFINFDDDDYVLNNAHVTSGLSWQTLRWSLTAVTAGNWHPVTWLSHAADCELFGLSPVAPHTVNLLLHILSALLLFLLLQAATKMPWRSLVVTGLFAWHPLNVESVVWISERKNTLSTLFLFFTLITYGRYVRRPNWQRYTVVAVVFALGLAAKSMLVTVPVVLLLIDYWPLKRVQGTTGPECDRDLAVPQASWPLLLREKLPLFLLSIAAGVVTLFAQKAGKSLQSLQALPLPIRLETAARAYALYILKAFWPSGLAIYYPNPFDSTLTQQPGAVNYLLVALGLALLGGVSELAWRYRQSKPYFFTGWFWYVITLLPVIGIVQVGAQGIADRYAYVPLIGLFVLAVWGVGDVAASLRLASALLPALATGVLAALCLLTFHQISYWKSSDELWQHDRAVTANNYVAADKIAVLLLHERNRAAFDYYREAARIAPWDPVSHEAVAALAASQGRMADAIEAYQVVIRGSDSPEVIALAYSNLSMIYTITGDYAHARSSAQQAMQKAPQRIEAEIRQMSASLATTPDADGYFHLAMLLEQDGQMDAARTACKKAIDLSHGSPQAKRFLDHLG
jgi:protein O-mannosyl-transferase